MAGIEVGLAFVHESGAIGWYDDAGYLPHRASLGGACRGSRAENLAGARVAQDVSMTSKNQLSPPGEALLLQSLIAPTPHGIASRVLARTGGGNVTLFAFDEGQGLTEHTSPFEALVMVLDGALILTIGGTPVRATPGTLVRMPADVAHAVEAPEPARMLLIMLRSPREDAVA